MRRGEALEAVEGEVRAEVRRRCGHLLRLVRETHGLRLADLGAVSEVNSSTLSRTEHGDARRPLSGATAEHLARGYERLGLPEAAEDVRLLAAVWELFGDDEQAVRASDPGLRRGAMFVLLRRLGEREEQEAHDAD